MDRFRITPTRALGLLCVAIVVVGGWQYRWIADDAMIDFRIVHNLLHGHGPVYNVGERVEVYTNPLWVAILALARLPLFFLPTGWIAVIVGIGLSAAAVYLAATRPGNGHSSLPVGLVVFACIPATWEFVTSGLETSLSFFYLGLSLYLVARVVASSRGFWWAAGVVSLGSLVRPDLLIYTLCFGVVLWWAQSRSRQETTRLGRLRLLGVLAGPTLLYEVFRMAYFGLLVSNTALVKSATSLRPGQGINYLANALWCYGLLIPLALALAGFLLLSPESSRIRGLSPRAASVALVVGGVIQIAYVVAIGGDFMHARMVMPGIFAIAAGWRVSYPLNRRSFLILTPLAVYLVVLVSALRIAPPSLLFPSFVNDERTVERSATSMGHPISEADMRMALWYRYGLELRSAADRVQGPTQLALSSSPTMFAPRVSTPQTIRARENLRWKLIAPSRTAGQVGLASGDSVYVYDELSLANPISSHFQLTVRLKPGHEKVSDLDWFLGRFGTPADTLAAQRITHRYVLAPITLQHVIDAQAALRCGPLHSYLIAIDAPLTPKRMISNMVHAVSWTRFTMSKDPTVARAQLCGH